MAAANASSSSSSSLSYQSHEPPPRSELLWDRLPSLKIVRPPKGRYSPQVDERCFTYCSQSISGRIQGNDPWCRTICFRRVFSHEVTRVLAHHRTQTIKHDSGKKPAVEIKEEVETVPVDHPLPPEGQRYSGWLAMLLGDRFSPSQAEDGHHADDIHAHEQLHSSGMEQREPRYWREGWYLWWTTSRWAAQEKLDLMRRDLEGQAEWQRLKDKRNDEWARGVPPFEDVQSTQAQGDGQPQMDVHPFEDLGNLPPFPDVSSHTVLLPLPLLPTSIPALFTSLQTQLRPALAPTGNVLELVQESVRSGAQRELWGRVWEKAWSDEPRKLLVVAWGRVRENFWGKEDEGGQDETGAGKKGEGKD